MVLGIIQLLTLLLLVGSLLFAGVVGGRPERAAAAIVFASVLLTLVAQAVSGPTPEFAFLLIDALTGAGLLLVLLRWKLFWSGVACCAQTLMLAFTATRFFNFPLSERGYVAMLQVSTVVLSAALISGAWARRWPAQDPYELA